MSVYKPDIMLPGVVAATDPISDKPALDKAIPPTTSFSSMTDRAFFMLGPIYEFVRVPFDLVSQFIEDTKTDADIQVYAADYLALQGLKNWPNIFYSLPKTVAPLFIRWMVTQVFNNKALGVIWQIRAREVEMADPGSIHLRKFPYDNIPVTIFLPYCEKVVLDAYKREDVEGYKLAVNSPELYNFPTFDVKS
jgi:hypothetical protein